MNDVNAFADRYVAVWNESDAAKRDTAVVTLWTEDTAHIPEPPQAVRDIAADLNSVPFLQARGDHEIENRVARAFEKIVAAGEFFFRSRSNGVRLADLIELNWEMVSTGGDVKAVGLAFVLLNTDERIRLDYQFIERGETS